MPIRRRQDQSASAVRTAHSGTALRETEQRAKLVDVRESKSADPGGRSPALPLQSDRLTTSEAVFLLWGIIRGSVENTRCAAMPLPVNRPFAALLLVLSAMAISSCGTSELHLSATAGYETATGGLDSLRASATVARARMQITLDFAGTRVSQVEQARSFLRSNLSALGTEIPFIDANLSQLQWLPSPVTASGSSKPTGAKATPRTLTNLADEATPAARISQSVIVTPATRARTQGIVLASDVADDDCAVDINPRFTPDSQKIYVVARAFDIPAGAELSASWQRQGTEVVLLSFEPEYAIDDNCIWFFIDQSDTPFYVGSWAVQIRSNGEAISPLVVFQIVGG